MNQYKHTYQNKLKGFTLIEFLVGSALALIVIMAAGSTYFLTRQLNDSAQERIDVQNNMRNAALMIMRDARVAGSFGCFSTGGILSGKAQKVEADVSAANTGAFPKVSKGTAIVLDTTKKGGYGVNLLAQNTQQLGDQNIAPESQILVFIYGKNENDISALTDKQVTAVDISVNNPDLAVAAKKGDMVLSSCYDSYYFQSNGLNGNNIAADFGSADLSGYLNNPLNTLTISRLYASAYFITEIQGTDSLVRYDLDTSGNWVGPQLLATRVSAMDVSFAYVENCNANADIPSNSTTFVYTDTPQYNNLPALIQIQLTYQVADGADDSNYLINASVRGGNICSTISKKGTP